MPSCPSPTPAGSRPAFGLATTAACGAAVAYLVVLGDFLVRGLWIRDGAGHPIVTDFLPVYVAGTLARGGRAALAYDWQHFHRLQVDFVGHPFAGFLGWHYPPLFFAVAMLLSLAGYLPAFLAWVGATALAFLATICVIARRPAAAWMALALSPALACALVGQNGFFTATILGLALIWLPRRPLLSGVAFAALTFKPQLGILIPFALLAGGHYRALAAAALLTLAWVGLGLWCAPESFTAFLQYLPQTSHAVLGDGASGWIKIQSVYAASRILGADDRVGWALQIVTSIAACVICAAIWRRRDIDPDLKAAALCCGALLATPYLYFYDLPILAVPLAFLFRNGGFDKTERVALGALFACLAFVAVLPVPAGVPAILIAAILIVRRVLAKADFKTPLPVLPPATARILPPGSIPAYPEG